MTNIDRRHFLQSASALGVLSAASSWARSSPMHGKVRPFPLAQVRLTPSPWLDAQQANLRFLLSLEPDRLLARFRENAGLTPKAPLYGGWESDIIAGHTLGHYLSALSLHHAHTGDAETRRRADYIVAELALCQSQGTDGYVAALGRRVDGVTHPNGKALFDDVMKGHIDPRFGNLNGGWAPLYNLHKTLAGLLDAHQHLGNVAALEVALGLAAYIDRVFSTLDTAATQLVLDCEHGGLQESIAELYARTGTRRWLDLARRLRHEKTFRPLAQQHDEMDALHSNTEIPKYVGAARLYEVGGGEDNAAATRYFWHTVTRQRSYVVGGNGDREWFYAKGQISRYITDQTCEHCSTYNMLKIGRHLFQWEPHGRWFDFYERAHLNHTLAAQNPKTGMFAYMMPLMAGATRSWSRPVDQFWCCMGSGMEAHAKHGESIFWQGGSAAAPALYVNEFIPSTLAWPGVGAFELRTRFPHSETVELLVTRAEAVKPLALHLRVPAWTRGATLTVNGKPVALAVRRGYAVLRRRLIKGDTIVLTLPMSLYREATPDDPSVHAYLLGPMVLAADLGHAGGPLLPEDSPAVLAEHSTPAKAAGSVDIHILSDATGEQLTLRPFYRQWNNRTAVYFTSFPRAAWPAEAARREKLRAAREATLAASVDVFHPGDAASENAHACVAERTELTPYRGRTGRLIKAGGGYLEADLRAADRPLTLYVSYWGEAERGLIDIMVDGALIATQRLEREQPGSFFEAAYRIPDAASPGKSRLRIRLQPRPDTRGPSVYGVRLA